MDNIEQFINICRKNFFQSSKDSYKVLIKDLIDWLYIRDGINIQKLNIYFKKDKKLRLLKNPTYLTDGKMCVNGKELCFIFNDDLMKKYYKENNYIGFIDLIFHEWGHFLQLLILNNICKSKFMHKHLLDEGELELDKIKKLNISDITLIDKNLEAVRNFAKWIELSNRCQVIQGLEELVSDVREYFNNNSGGKQDLLILDNLEKNLILEKKIYDYLSHTIGGEHIIENANTPKQLEKEIKKFNKWYGGRFVVLESIVLGLSIKF